MIYKGTDPRILAALAEVRRAADDEDRGLFRQQLAEWAEEDEAADPASPDASQGGQANASDPNDND